MPVQDTLDQALSHHQAGNLELAQRYYRDILAEHPREVNALHLLGVVCGQLGDLDAALNHLRRALDCQPNSAEIHSSLGVTCEKLERLDEAAACYRQALEHVPDHVESLCNLGNVLNKQGKPREALACWRKVLRCRPDHADAYACLGFVLREQGHLVEAAAMLQEALRIEPDHAEALNNLGITLQAQRKLDGAVAKFREVLRLKPDYAEAYNNLAVALKEQGKLDDAENCWRQALALKPMYAEAAFNLGTSCEQRGRLEEAEAQFAQAVRLRPDRLMFQASWLHARQNLCLWEGIEAQAQALVDAFEAGAGSVSPFVFLALPAATDAAQQLRCARRWAGESDAAPPAHEPPLESSQAIVAGSPMAGKRLKIGYLSADFYGHATAVLTAELFEKHDRGRVEVFGYSYGPDDGGPMRRRLMRAFDHFVDLRYLSNPEAAQRISADGIDVLVDLKGYTRDARPGILELRPAPIQVNYLGYPGTMGAACMDYILVDQVIVPADQQTHFSECLVHLPGCYQVNDSSRSIAGQAPSRRECGLPDDGFVFCCFNNNYKISPAMFSMWMRLLRNLPGSVLWLLESNRWAPANLRREAEARGVAGERLVFARRVVGAEHLARHRLADLFLDTFPYNAHTTASDSLWAGCPVITLAGRTFVSRVAASLLHALGLPELIVTSAADYEAAALDLARNAAPLAKLRQRLQVNRTATGLFDGGRFARHVERAFATMWNIYRAAGKPRGFAVPEL